MGGLTSTSCATPPDARITDTEGATTYRPASMPAPAGRVRVGGYLTPEAAEGWAALCARHGVNITALMEAAGLAFREPSADDEPLTKHLDHARRIEAERLRRRKK